MSLFYSISPQKKPEGTKNFGNGWGDVECYAKNPLPTFATTQDGAVLRVTTKNDTFVGAATQLVFEGAPGPGGPGIVRHFTSRLVMSAAVSGLFFGALTDKEFPSRGSEPATALADPMRSEFSVARAVKLEELSWASESAVRKSGLEKISMQFVNGAAAALTVPLKEHSAPWVWTSYGTGLITFTTSPIDFHQVLLREMR